VVDADCGSQIRLRRWLRMVVKKDTWVARQAAKMGTWGKASWPTVKPLKPLKLKLGRRK
jgi:hypothetical protein